MELSVGCSACFGRRAACYDLGKIHRGSRPTVSNKLRRGSRNLLWCNAARYVVVAEDAYRHRGSGFALVGNEVIIADNVMVVIRIYVSCIDTGSLCPHCLPAVLVKGNIVGIRLNEKSLDSVLLVGYGKCDGEILSVRSVVYVTVECCRCKQNVLIRRRSGEEYRHRCEYHEQCKCHADEFAHLFLSFYMYFQNTFLTE